MSKREDRLYPDIERWLKRYIKDRYKGYTVSTTHETSKRALDMVLKDMGIYVKETEGLSIKIDVVGILKRGKNTKLVFVEVKDKALNLKDLGQLWGYTQLINPLESFLISSKGLDSLDYLFNVLKREDLLFYGLKKSKMMKVARWDERRKSIDFSSLIPKL